MPKKAVKEEEAREPLIQFSTLIVFGAYAILVCAFLFFLNDTLGLPFNVIAFVIGLIIALVITGFLMVVRSVMRSNAWEGLAVGLVTIIVVVAALLVKFRGMYTYIFATVGSLIAVIYIGYYFKKSSTNTGKESTASQELAE